MNQKDLPTTGSHDPFSFCNASYVYYARHSHGLAAQPRSTDT